MDYVTRQFVNLTKKFRKELPKLSKLIHRDLKQHAEAVTAAKKSDEQKWDIQPVWLEPVLAKYQEPVGDKNANDKRQYRVQNSIRWATWSAFIAASIYAAITLYVAKQTRRAADYAESQANIAQRGFDEAHINVLMDQRAWVGVSRIPVINLAADSNAFIGVVIKNTGKTPALKNRTKFVLDIHPSGTGPNIRYNTRTYDSVSVVQPGQEEILPVGTHTYITKRRAEALKVGSIEAYVYGKILYVDIFGACHRTMFCFSVQPGEFPTPCATYNDADDKCE
jgi:hypothetical protein